MDGEKKGVAQCKGLREKGGGGGGGRRGGSVISSPGDYYVAGKHSMLVFETIVILHSFFS